MRLFKIFPKCGHCKSTRIKKGYFSRGWNKLCNQASGDNGYWCNHCFKISWIDSYERAIEKKKEWCTVNKKTTTTVII